MPRRRNKNTSSIRHVLPTAGIEPWTPAQQQEAHYPQDNQVLNDKDIEYDLYFFFSKIDEYQSGMTIFNNLRSIDHFTWRIITSISKFLQKVHEIQICFDRQRMASSNVVLWNEEKIDLGFKFVEEISKSSIDWYLLTRGLIGWPFVTVVKKPYHCGHLTLTTYNRQC